MNRSLIERLSLPSFADVRRMGAAVIASFGIAGFSAEQAWAGEPVQNGAVPYLPYHDGGMRPHEVPRPAPATAGQAQELRLEQPFTADEKKFLQKKVVYMYGLRCSGALIENSADINEGAVTAAHCNLRDGFSGDPNTPNYYGTWIKGAHNQEYIVEPEGVTAETGMDQAFLQPAGSVSEFILPSDGSASNSAIDQAIAVFGNNDPKQVLQDYRNSMLSPRDTAGLKPGKTTISFGGWPVDQKGDGYNNMIRQDIKTLYVGKTMVSPNYSGEYLKVIAAAVKTDSNGAYCSPGASGSEGFVDQTVNLLNGANKHVMKSVGDLAVFWPFKPIDQFDKIDANANKKYFAKLFPKFNQKGVAAVCGFAPKLYNNNDFTAVKVVQNVSDIPKPVVSSPQSAEELAPYNTTAKFEVFLGSVVINRPAPVSGVIQELVNNPIIYAEPGETAIIYANKLIPQTAEAELDPNQDLTFYPQGRPRLISTTSMGINYRDTSPTGSFVNAKNFNFGTLAPQYVPASGQAYKLSYKDGKSIFTPVIK